MKTITTFFSNSLKLLKCSFYVCVILLSAVVLFLEQALAEDQKLKLSRELGELYDFNGTYKLLYSEILEKLRKDGAPEIFIKKLREKLEKLDFNEDIAVIQAKIYNKDEIQALINFFLEDRSLVTRVKKFESDYVKDVLRYFEENQKFIIRSINTKQGEVAKQDELTSKILLGLQNQGLIVDESVSVQNSRSSDKVPENKFKLAQELVKIDGSYDSINDRNDSYFNKTKVALNFLPDWFFVDLKKYLDGKFKEEINQLAKLQALHFTEKDLNRSINFYKTSVGKSIAAKSLKFSKEVEVYGEKIFSKASGEALKESGLN